MAATPIRYIRPSAFSDDESSESSSESSSEEQSDLLRREYPDYPAQDEGGDGDGGNGGGPDPLRREYPDYPAQDEGDDGGGDGGGSSDGGGSGGGSGGGTAPAATPSPDDDRKKRHHAWKKKKREEARAAALAAKGQPPPSAIDKSVARNQRKTQVKPPPPPPPPPPPAMVMPTIIRPAQVQAQVAARPLTQRLNLVAPVAKAPAPATRRKFGHDYVPVEDDGFAEDPNAPGEYENIAWELGDKWETTPKEVQAVFGVLTIDDMTAIQRYMADTLAATPEATKIKDEYTAWYDGLYWFQKTSQSSYDKARNYRNLFNLANATTPEDKAAIQDVIKAGLSTEQAQGDIDRRTSTGMYAISSASLMPWEIAGVIIAALTLLVGVNAAVKR